MSEGLLFAKIAEPEMTTIKFNDHFHDQMGKMDRGHIEIIPQLWNLRPYDKMKGEITRIPRLLISCQKVREEIKDWGDYRKMPEETAEFLLI